MLCLSFCRRKGQMDREPAAGGETQQGTARLGAPDGTGGPVSRGPGAGAAWGRGQAEE